MLRVILGTLGVALIAFGLFGGKSLEQVYAGLNGLIDKYSGSGDSEQILADANDQLSATGVQQESTSSAVLAPAVTNTATNAVANTNTDNAANGIASQSAEEASGSDSTVAAAASDSNQQQQTSLSAVASASDAGTSEQRLTVADASATDSVESKSTSANAAAEVDKAADGALKEVKASARNEEIELARGNQEGEKVELPKEAVVGEVLQTTAGENQVKALFVLKDLVNMREGPSIDHPVVLRLEKGQELMEFKRDGKWVHVGAYGTSGKIGWVHQRLVGKTPG
jgi:hypothetical protein